MSESVVFGKKVSYLFFASCICFLLCFLYKNSVGQGVVRSTVLLKSDISPELKTPAVWLQNHNNEYPCQVLLQFHQLPSAETRNYLKEHGVVFADYIPDNAYIAILQSKPEATIFTSIKYVADVLPEWKIRATSINSSAKQRSTRVVEVDVNIFDMVSMQQLLHQLERVDASIIKDRLSTMGYCHVSIPEANMHMLAEWYGVRYISPHAEDHALGAEANAITRGHIAKAPVASGGYDLKGEGTAIGIGDNVSGIYHIDLLDRIVNFNPGPYDYHGLHISGIAGGAGIVDPKGEGMAPAATLTNHFFSDVLQATPHIFSQYGVSATNNSYSAFRGSCEYAGTYDGISNGLDKLSLSYDKVLHVFAAANDGLFDCSPFIQGFATIAGGYQTAKNAIVVGSADKQFVNAVTSSRGPTKDGRLKPEITAIGVDVNSTAINNEYVEKRGTSMACPQVAAAAALLTERFRKAKGVTSPRSDVLKALLINGARDIGIPGPDFSYGFGIMDVERSIVMLDSTRYITGSVNNTGQMSYNIIVPQGVSTLKILAYWHDEAASPMSQKQLVNDIDLEVNTPGGTVHYPLVPDHTAANVDQPAVEQPDKLNNCEQVTINNPSAGNYTIFIKGATIPSGNKNFVVAYDYLPNGITVKNPHGGMPVKADDSLYIYWDAPGNNGTFTIEFSNNIGGSWVELANNIPATQRHYKWITPNVNSARCRIRVRRNAEQGESDIFVMNRQPELKLSDIQCPGYVQIEWDLVPGAINYEVMRKAGPALVSVDTVAAGSYIFSGLNLDSTYWVAMRPIIDGVGGYRSLAISRKPDDGDCTGPISDGDIMIDNIFSPQTGRKFTATELSGNHVLKIRIRNLDDARCDSFRVSYNLNNSGWVDQVFTDGIAEMAQRSVTVPGLNLAAIGDYTLAIAIENLHMVDKVGINDTIVHYFSQLPNDPVTLDFSYGFEDVNAFESIKDTMGVGESRRWDYQRTTDTGRIRSLVLGNNTTISGNYSISMDAYKNCPGNYNGFKGTFNMGAYSVADEEVRLEFDYILHGVPSKQNGNEVFVRGSDLKALHSAYKYNVESANVGRVQNSGSISLNDVLLDVGDDFSASTQIEFGQSDSSVIGNRSFGKGLTFDNVRIYTVQNDIQLLSIVAPENFGCGITGSVPLTVKLRNGVNNALTDIAVSYRLDNGAVVTEVLASLAAKTTVDFTFNTLLPIEEFGAHSLDVWVSANGDSYLKNDSLLNYVIRNQPIITTYPYDENFESGDGYWYAEGINSSWEYGTPAATGISEAASGSKAWVTKLDGNYNDNERSFLYSPCFDLSTLDKPKLRFMVALDIENCEDVFCDGAYVEYTLDGESWQKLGEPNKGTNWYNDTSFFAWTLEDNTMWRVAETELPANIPQVQLRYGLYSDGGSTREGIGVDDIRIYNEVLYAPDNNIISISPNPVSDGNINIEWAAYAGTQFSMTIADITGKEVFRTQTEAVEGYNKTTLHTPLFSSGMYFMRIIIGDNTHKRKIVYLRR